MAGGSFLAILRIAGFFTAVWGVGKLAKFINVSSIVFEITVGLIFSPSLLPASLMPPPYADCQHHHRYAFGVRKNMFNDYCNRPEAIMSLGDHHHHLSHMLDHRHEEKASYGCRNELVAFDEANYTRVSASGDSSGSHDRRVSSGSALNPWACEDSSSYESRISACSAFEALVTCTVKECDQEIAHLCGIEPNFFTLVGHTGVSLMIFESGMHFDFKKAAVVGPWASVVAVLGTFLPLLAGLGLTFLLNPQMEDKLVNGLAAGVALAPTSVGIALKLLLEAKQLQKNFGQAIITAAFVDDILSLILFNLLFSTTSGDFSIVDVVVKPLVGCIWMLIFGSMGMWFWPGVVRKMTETIPAKKGGGSLSRPDEVLLLLLFALLISYGTFTFFLGTHLWGCFIAGMSFAMVHHAHHVWVKQTKRITSWMLRVFFSCTVAFAIPFASLFTLDAFWKGSVLGIFACILTKVLCAFYMGPARWVIGWAMVGRAEFAYLIAEMAKSAGIMSQDMFAMVIWALLYATIFAPFIFRMVLKKYVAQYENEDEEEKPQVEAKKKNNMRKSGSVLGDKAKSQAGRTIMDGHKWLSTNKTAFRFQIIQKDGTGDCSIEDLTEIWDVVRKFGMKVTQVKQQCDKETHFSIFQIQGEDGEKLEDNMLNFVQDGIYQEMNGRGAHIIWLPPTNALEKPCKLAKVTMVCDLAGLSEPVNSVAEIVESICGDAFFVMRSSMELHGKSMTMTFLVAHADAKEADPRSPPASPRSPRTATIKRYQSKAEFGMEYLLLGSAELPDIQPKFLESLRKRVEEKFPNRIYIVIDPVSHAMGPLGHPNHDAVTLASAQLDEPTVEIRFFLDSMNYELFAEVLKILSTFNVALLSGRLDERAFCQVNLCISGNTLKEKDQEIINLLHAKAEALGCIGYMDRTNLDTPDMKETKLIGEPIAPVSALPRPPVGKAEI